MLRTELEHYIDLCLDSHRICLETVTYLQTRDRAVEPEAIRLLFNCAEACHLSAGLLRDAGRPNGRAWAVCAEVCEQSARYCEELGDDPRLLACAAACRRCAEACQHLAAAA